MAVQRVGSQACSLGGCWAPSSPPPGSAPWRLQHAALYLTKKDPTLPPHTPGVPVYLFACRYRVTAYPDWTVERVKRALFGGGIARANKPEGVRNTPGIQVRPLGLKAVQWQTQARPAWAPSCSLRG